MSVIGIAGAQFVVVRFIARPNAVITGNEWSPYYKQVRLDWLSGSKMGYNLYRETTQKEIFIYGTYYRNYIWRKY